MKVPNRIEPDYGRRDGRGSSHAISWADYLSTLSDEQIEFANELFARAAEINREEIELLREE